MTDTITPDERTLDRRVHYDPRSRAFSAAEPVRSRPARSYSWYLGQRVLDQGREGACVGFSVAHEGAAKPAVRPQDEASARHAYHLARQIDRDRHGLNFAEGATVIAGMKAGQELGLWTGYEWSFSLADLVLAVGYRGPTILGTWWKSGMWRPDANGFISATGTNAGGHAYVALAVDVKAEVFMCANSWGAAWSRVPWRKAVHAGHFLVRFADMERLLLEQGEAATPVGRRRS